MLRETVLDLRNVARDMPWFAAAVLLSVALCVGVNASVLGEAEEEHLRLSANRVDVPMASSIEEVKSRLLHRCPAEKIPGFTVIVALRQYSVELSVPMGRVRLRTDDARARMKGSLKTVNAPRTA
jgi:hypothetical protein